MNDILICCSLIKHFPDDHKRYSSHLQVLILHQLAPIKVYIKLMRALKAVKNNFRTIHKGF